MSEIEKGKIKAKRKIKALDFSGTNAAVALVSKDQGGPANSFDSVLTIKAQNFSDEFLEKMSKIRVELDLVEFLSKFFGLYYEDAEILAALMGYEREDDDYDFESYEDYIQSKLESFEILKAVAESDNLSETLSSLTEDQYFGMLQDQEKLEQVFKAYDKNKSDKEKNKRKPRVKTVRSFTDANTVVSKAESPNVEQSTAADVDTSTVQHEVKEGKGIGPVIVKSKTKEKLMTQDVKIVEQVVETEMIEKSVFEAIQKQAQEQAELLKSALAELEVFKAEKQALIAKSRKQAIVDAVKDEAKAEQLFKAVGELADEKFESVVDVFKSLSAQVEKSDLFVEKGATVDVKEDEVKESAVAKLLKAKLQAGK